jgi:ABC-type dipeptide/oligopeptide/nickel transport system permease subunit
VQTKLFARAIAMTDFSALKNTKLIYFIIIVLVLVALATFDVWLSFFVERKFAIVTLITGWLETHRCTRAHTVSPDQLGTDDYLLGAIALGRRCSVLCWRW